MRALTGSRNANAMPFHAGWDDRWLHRSEGCWRMSLPLEWRRLVAEHGSTRRCRRPMVVLPEQTGPWRPPGSFAP
jgi:hypothetical protein